MVIFSPGLGDRPFVDEYAYITQSYQPDLLLTGRAADPTWLEGLTYDLVPLPKYLINGAYRIARIPRPYRRDAIAWYKNTSYRWGATTELVVARLPSVLMAAIGCAAIFCLGSAVQGPAAGWLAAGLLAANPLYRLHAHRAMSEAPCEALSLVALAVAIRAWSGLLARPSGLPGPAIAMLAAGGFAGLAVLAKFNGLLVLLVLAAWALLGMGLPWVAATRKLALAAATALAGVVALAIFIALTPFLTVHPRGPLPAELQAIDRLSTWQRLRFLLDHRVQVSRDQQSMFPHNALRTPADRVAVLAVQGFGRFGPLGPARSDSEKRYDLAQDWGALLWLPLVLIGFGRAAVGGLCAFRAGESPLPWLVAAWAGVAVLVVAAYLPMAWDRYLLPIQGPATLLAAPVLADAGRALGRRLFPARVKP